MKILELINENLISLDLQSTTKEKVVDELALLLFQNGLVTDKDLLVNEVMKRERHSSTGIGFGIAIPHAKSSIVKKPSLVFGKSKQGVDYESMDDEPAYIFFLIAVPETSLDLHLKTLATLSRKLIDDEFRESLLHATTKKEVLTLLKKVDKENK